MPNVLIASLGFTQSRQRSSWNLLGLPTEGINLKGSDFFQARSSERANKLQIQRLQNFT